MNIQGCKLHASNGKDGKQFWIFSIFVVSRNPDAMKLCIDYCGRAVVEVSSGFCHWFDFLTSVKKI